MGNSSSGKCSNCCSGATDVDGGGHSQLNTTAAERLSDKRFDEIVETGLERAPASPSATPKREESASSKRGFAVPILDDCVELAGPQPITCDDLAAMLPESFIVDVRGADFYGGHIPDSIRLPFEDLLENPVPLHELATRQFDPETKHVIFCCMNGDNRSRLCSEKLFSILEEKQKGGDFMMDLEVGYVAGGMQCWVNRMVSRNSTNTAGLLTDFDREAWVNPEGGPLVHKSATALADLFELWGNKENLSKSLRRAKSLLVHSKSTTFEAVNTIANKYTERCQLAGQSLLKPEDIDIDHGVELGSGASAVVILAEHKPTKDKLAVKAMNIENPTNRRQLFNSLSFFTEAWVRQENCAGLMRLHAVFADESRVFLAMDLMDMGGVNNLLELENKKKLESPSDGSGCLGLPEVINGHVMRQAMDGLRALHSHNLLHRDVKPENILVNSFGEARVADYGLSTMLEQEAVDHGKQENRKGLVRSTSFVGTEKYLSPQRAKGQGITQKEDVWALGMVIYELATTQHAFQDLLEETSQMITPGSPSGSPVSLGFAEVFGKLLEKVERDKGLSMPDDGAGFGTFSAELRDLVAQCLRKRPSERPTSTELMTHSFFLKFGANADATRAEWDKWLKEVKWKPKT